MKAGIQVYIDSISYDEFEQKVFCKYGNSTSQTYTYSTTLRRLSNLVSKDHSGNNMYNLSYTFDKIGNVDSIHNSAGIISEMVEVIIINTLMITLTVYPLHTEVGPVIQ
ncbi:MAG: hypothetical protein IPG55_20870 [Saprospiraceae bacterium]|nr:hypothetical protein [Candidatus Defluviibacterium haderslevense]